MKLGNFLLATLLGASSAGIMISREPPTTIHVSSPTFHAIDGDTLKSGRTRYRIAGIDAPELPGHCAASRHCAPGDPFAAWAYLQAQVVKGMTCITNGIDVYSRPLITCTLANGRDLAGDEVANGFAIPYTYHHTAKL
jgi:endonuclease YncB( thermonuclease family)